MAPPTGPYVREAKLPEEFRELSLVAARAFASHPLKNYFSHQKTAIHLQKGKRKEKSLRQLANFEESILLYVKLLGGRIMVVAVPEEDGKERLAACAAWTPPGASEKESLMVIIRAKYHRTVRAWGMVALKRIVGEFTPVQEKQREKAAERYGIKNNDYWYLELLFTNPEDEGRGHCGKLLREFEAYEPTKLFMLNAASERSIAIYHHYGWKTFDQHMLGVGKVAADGTAAKGEQAKGVLLELMVKEPAKTQ
ncbi:uncharacterized protein SCHCODRAFT_02569994 [Schizophyllum commune H4-8]|uniref:uncharacterized protein n=1 Tax=Schizophyllum commune (strain H4-8 / FGSC 9210) TaxID=578458 RepID=UPI00215E07A0|nr:uncharacterized protein SCHCODRAFT_02569994 [Schizophyllum commune H4-8]KAI5896859.1 hypothetical protein SCHCODRAFT_02569994 [Schizophyllum commune H4-8]